jgi:hypothetical protein
MGLRREARNMKKRKAIVCASVISIVLLMVFSAFPTSIGGWGSWVQPKSATVTKVFEVGTDQQWLPPDRSGLFLPFMKYEMNIGPGSRGLFLYRPSILNDYGLDFTGNITRLSLMNMWGAEVYDHPTAGPQFSPGTSEFLNFRLKMGLSTLDNTTNLYDNHYDVAGPVTVVDLPGWNTLQGTHMNWMDFPLSTDFEFDGTSSLIIEYDWDGVQGYDMGSFFGGTWTGQYERLSGNMMTGLFQAGYTPITWSPFENIDTGSLYGPPDSDHLPVLQLEVEVPAIPATVDVDPNTLNLKSKGKWITSYIGLPEDFDVADIDVSTLEITKLNGAVLPTPIEAKKKPTGIHDHDGDGEPDLMVKFDRSELISAIRDLGIGDGDDLEITLNGELFDGSPFAGSDTILVIWRGRR